jgi:leucyl-tRNA synthetase
MLAPFAPHVAVELGSRVGAGAMGGAGSIVFEAYPVGDPAQAADDVIEVPVQVQGKVRARIMVAPGADAKAMEAAALADPKVQELIAGKAVKRVIVVPGKMVNVVV